MTSVRHAILVTGATSGIGCAASTLLARGASSLFLVGRNERRGQSLRSRLTGRHPGVAVEFIPADISSLADVRRLAGLIRQRTDRLDVLINNAGARFDTFQSSRDGIELTFATNHLGHFLLTALLLDLLMASPDSRIVNVSSSAHHAATRPEQWLETPDCYDRRQAYARAKLANLLFTYALSRRLAGRPPAVNAFHPGGVASAFARNNGFLSWARHLVAHALKRELISPRRAAESLFHLAVSPAVAGLSGRYFFQTRPVDSSPLSRDPALAESLWRKSLELAGLDDSLGPAWRWFQP